MGYPNQVMLYSNLVAPRNALCPWVTESSRGEHLGCHRSEVWDSHQTYLTHSLPEILPKNAF